MIRVMRAVRLPHTSSPLYWPEKLLFAYLMKMTDLLDKDLLDFLANSFYSTDTRRFCIVAAVVFIG